ncbi:MAG TPA: hypothetical protein VHO90_18985 [Bacteroidales bacterium]|nr:hypothetical protein [Bacteroidales bacterium]
MLMAAACIVLLMLSSFLTISLLRTQKSVNNQAQIIRKLSQQPSSSVASIKTRKDTEVVQRTDTVYIAKEKIVTIPVEITKLKADTIYIDQVIYVEKGKSAEQAKDVTEPLNVESEAEPKPSRTNTQIYISDSENQKQGKTRKLKLRLGGEKNQENSGSLALTAKY